MKPTFLPLTALFLFSCAAPGLGEAPPGLEFPPAGDSSGGIDASDDGTPDVLLDVGVDPDPIEFSSKIDVLVVIDNSGTMGEEQRNLARNLPGLVERLENLTDGAGAPVDPDVHIMVTTTDLGNPLCTAFEPEGYDPGYGAPTYTACTSRIEDFEGLDGDSIPEACTDSCPGPVAPAGYFIAFGPEGHNVPGAVPTDFDGDGDLDSPAAQALSCIGPQGINGCGYEAPLESMVRALDPGSEWNTGDAPFLRGDALLAIVVVTDEADCSVRDWTMMEDETHQEVNPSTGLPTATSAVCWNAGVFCVDSDDDGVYESCESNGDALHPVTRYVQHLQYLSAEKEVVMLGILGVPKVLAHSDEPPHHPIVGGADDLAYRGWIPGVYPNGDILPEDHAAGETADSKEFAFGIGPGCTGQDDRGSFTGQAIPPVRILEVCESLNRGDDNAGIRCCIESICDDDFTPAIECLTGILQSSIPAAG